MQRRDFLRTAAALPLTGLVTHAHAAEEKWPTRPVRIVVPYTPGGSSDIIARLISADLSKALGESVVVENRPGANGNLGTGIVAKADDGHTLLLCDIGALAITPSVYTKLTFDPSKDLRPVSMLAYSPHVLAVHPSFPAKTLPEIVELSKKQRVNFAVTAIGSAPHLAAVAVQQATGAKWEYVPYKGGAQAISDTVGGQTEVIMNGLLATLPHIRSGNLRAIAISKRERMQLIPDIPTIAEQGVTGFESGTWQGIMAPATLPAATAERLAKILADIAKKPEIVEKLNQQGAEVVTYDPAQLGKFYTTERDRWAKVVKSVGITLD
ncbi:Bug family tripartite tricarboxylate transporter substrate binding protein [Bordetella muralis]|uniref:Bug family tripartite tricarboxylate transporter substrate binding protein n=1 Tax=Bordetella muralis TaxID=1649130 RepID=UPI0039F0ED7A